MGRGDLGMLIISNIQSILTPHTLKLTLMQLQLVLNEGLIPYRSPMIIVMIKVFHMTLR